LKGSGAWVTIVLRLGHKSTPGRTQLLYDIDGEEGTLKIQDDRVMGMNIGAQHPEHIYLNGEELGWDSAEDGEAYENPIPFIRDNWLEFYKGKENGGNYVDIEDAVRIRDFLGAIQTSVDEGGKWIEL
jgi:predicted dehydrogenase